MTDKPSLSAILYHYGAAFVPDYGYNRSIRCPFHDDRTASASVNVDDGLFQCFRCGIAGDVYSVIMKHEGVDFAEAKRRAEAIAGEGDGEVREEPRQGRYLPLGPRVLKGDSRRGASRRRRRTRAWT